MIATRFSVFSPGADFLGDFTEAKSAALLFSEQMAIGLSIAPRRHAVSQGWVHTLPRICGKRFAMKFNRKEASKSPATMRSI
ncbi:MAG: hypothetical protein HCAMLNBO_02243 [Candidatus Brocadia fulgida]|nr:hypothetical protein [Candidatus Brocadia fulgida]